MKKLEEMRKKFHSQKLKNEQGSITLFVIIAMLFFLTIGLIIFIANVNNSTSQQRDVRKIQSEYNRVSDSELDDIYNEQVKKQTGKLVITVIDRWKEIYETGTWTNSEDNKLPLTVIITWPEGIKESEKTIKLEGTINGKEIKIEIKDGRITGTVPTGIDISNLIQSTDNGFVLNDGVTDCQLKVSATVNDQTTEVVIKVDRTNPTVELGPNGGNFWINPSIGEKTKTLESTITASDTNSGVKEIKYIWSESDTLPGDDSAWQTITNGTKVTSNPLEEGVYYLYVKVTDEAGNETIIKSSPFVVKEANYQIITGNNKDYAVTLAEAVNAANDGSTINVLQNYEDLSVTDTNNTAQGVLINKNVTIDTLGRTLTMENRITVASEKTVNFIDTATTKGKIERTTGYLVTNNGTVKVGTNSTNGANMDSADRVIFGTGGNVEVNDGKLNVTGESKLARDFAAIYAKNITINGGEIINDYKHYGIIGLGSINITGGKVKGKDWGIHNGNGNTTLNISDNAEITSSQGIGVICYSPNSSINITGQPAITGATVGIYIYANSQTMNIAGGAIKGGTSGIAARAESSGHVITIGDNTKSLDITKPTIQGNTEYGINLNSATSTLNYYDGKIIGKQVGRKQYYGRDVAFNIADGSTVQFREGYQPYTSDIEINNETYHETVLKKAVAVTADANGGTIDTAEGWEKAEDNKTAAKTVLIDTPYGTLPTVNERPGYTFKGWIGKNLYDFGSADDYYVYRNNMTIDVNEKSISVTKADSWAGDFWRNEKNKFEPGTYTLSAVFNENTNPRHIIYLYDENNNKIDNTNFSLSGFSWNNHYQGWFSSGNNRVVTVPSTVAYWKYGSSFSGPANEVAKISNIQIEEGTIATAYEPYRVIEANTIVSTPENHKIYANWKANNYTVTINANGGIIPTTTGWTNAADNKTATKTVTFDQAYGTLPEPTRSGYTFAGWYKENTFENEVTEESTYNIANHSMLYAKWTANTYTVHFDKNDNNATGTMENQSFNYDEEKALTANGFAKEGYTFTGWSTSASDESIVYDTKEFSGTKESGESGYKDFKDYRRIRNYSAGDVYQLDVDVKGSGQLVNYFYYSESIVNVANCTSLTSGFTGSASDGYNTIPLTDEFKHHTIRFTLGGSTNQNIEKRLLFRVFPGSSATIKNIIFKKVSPTSMAYVDQQIVKNLTAIANDNVNLYAIWTANTYTVAYNGNGATGGNTANSSHTYDVAKNLTENGYERKYDVTFNHNYTGSTNKVERATYEFDGWNVNAEGTGTNYTDRQSVTNLSSTQGATVTLYAKWTAASVNYTPTRAGYTFDGWFETENCSGTRVDTNGTYTPISAKTLYAKWKARTDTPYVVKHYQMDINGNYPEEPTEIENLTGTTDTKVTPEVKTYTGCISPETQEVTINGDGSTVVEYRYERNKAYLDLNGWLDGVSSENITGYGTADIWVNGIQIGDDWSDHNREYYYGSTYEIKDIKAIDGHKYNGLHSGSLTGTIGTSRISVLLDFTTQYTITYNLDGGSITGETKTYDIYTDTFTLPEPTKTGFTFEGWTGSNGDELQKTVTIEKGTKGNKEYNAHWGYYVEIFGSGYNQSSGKQHRVMIAGSKANTTNGRGVTVVKFNRITGAVIHTASYDTYADATARTEVAGIINNSTESEFIAIFSQDALRWNEDLKTSLKNAGIPAAILAIDYPGVRQPTAIFIGKGLTSDQAGIVKGFEESYTPVSYLKIYVKDGVPQRETYSIIYNLDGGKFPSEYQTYYSENTDTFTLTEPTKLGYIFKGWTGSNGDELQKTVTIEKGSLGDKLFTANWEEANYSVSVSENQTYYYLTLKEAVEKADATGSTITVLKNCDDTSEAITLDKDITINTNGKTVTMTNGITVSSDKTLNISGNGTIKKTSGDLITNNGTVITENATLEAGENVINGGNVTVKSGTIKGGTNGILVTSENSTVTIGEANVTLDEVTPTIIGSTEYGVNITKSNSTLNFYNGVIKGKKTVENKGVSVAFVSDGTTTYREGYGAITTEDNGLNKTVLGTVQFGVDPQEIYLNLDNNRTGSITPTGNGYGTATYSSSDDTVARVSNTGTVEARKEGEATITITEANSGKTVTCKVVVDTTLPVWTVTVKEIR